MRRTLFGKSPELERLAPPRASFRDTLLFDVSDQQHSADLTFAERRVDSWTFAPWLLFASHIILAVTWLVEGTLPGSHATLASIAVPMAVSLASDVVAGAVLFAWRRLQIAPH